MPQRYFVETPIRGPGVVLVESEAHHLLHVMRARPGMEVVVFDGLGAEYRSRVEKLNRNSVELAVLSRDEPQRELPFQLTLGVALPKGDRQRWLVEKAVELGVSELVPLRTERGVAQPVEQAVARLRRSVIEASKQCGRNRLMRIAQPLVWSEYVLSAPAAATRLMAHPDPSAGGVAAASLSEHTLLAIGPEGGFTGDEVVLAVRAGWQPVDLGPRVLRVETAAVLLAAMVLARTGL